MTGYLANKNDEWFVRWSDLHSFTSGTEWFYTPLHPDEMTPWYSMEGEEVEFIFYDRYDDPYLDCTYAKITSYLKPV